MREIHGREVTVGDVYEFIVDQREDARRLAEKYRRENPIWYRDQLMIAATYQDVISWIDENR